MKHSSYLLLFVFTFSHPQAKADITLRYLIFRLQTLVLIDILTFVN